MTLEKLLDFTIAATSGGLATKAIELWNKRRRDRVAAKLALHNQKVELEKIEIGSEEQIRKELWMRLENLENVLNEIRQKEQDCWRRYGELSQANVSLKKDLELVKKILTITGGEFSKLLPNGVTEET